MAESLDVLRTEKKYLISAATAGKIKRRLSCFLETDPHCRGQRPYTVNSVYFDAIDDRDFWEKCDGVELRKKIRLRSYGGGGPIKLEWKRKQGAKQRKQSLLISRQDERALIAGQYDCLRRYDTELAQRFYTMMTEGVYRPKCLIRYERLAYIEPSNDIRITFDSAIRTREGSFDLLREGDAFYPVMDGGHCILEIKYNHFLLDHIQTALTPFDLTETANSKYVRGRYFGFGVNVV